MDKNKFNELDIMDQIEYINSQLKLNKSLTSISNDLGIGRSTIRDRFKKLNYSYSKDLNKYVYNSSKTDVVRRDIEENNKSISDVIHIESKDNNINVSQVDKVKEIINKSDVEVKETIIDIVNNYDVLKEIIELHRRNTSVIKQQIVIDIEDAESKLITLRVNSKELELFNIFCEDNKQYRKIDLISQALKEFREKHS